MALEAYRRALKTGETFDKSTKLVVIGQDRVVKTSIGRYLDSVKNAGKGAWRKPVPLEHTSALDHKCAEVVAQELLGSSKERSDKAQLLTNVEKKTRGTEKGDVPHEKKKAICFGRIQLKNNREMRKKKKDEKKILLAPGVDPSTFRLFAWRQFFNVNVSF